MHQSYRKKARRISVTQLMRTDLIHIQEINQSIKEGQRMISKVETSGEVAAARVICLIPHYIHI